MPKSQLPTIDQAIERAMAKVDGPLEKSAFIDRVLKIRPSSAKGAKSSIHHNLKYNYEGKSFVYVGKKTMIPLRVAAPGVRFRIPLSRMEVDRGVLLGESSFAGWVTYRDKLETFEFVDERGLSLPTRVVSVERGIDEIMEGGRGFRLTSWFQANKARRNDSVLVTIESWEPKRFKLELEPQKKKRGHRDEIARKNQELADILFDMLETSVREGIRYTIAVPTAYIRLSDPGGYPGDHWRDLLKQDPRMMLTHFDITYPGGHSIFDMFLSDGEPPVSEQKFTAEQGKQVYRFKAAFKHRKSIWRRIEIQGQQTLSEFDDILRGVFGHDSSDHLSGFWKLVRRGQSKRVREVDLGSVDPLGGGDGADLRIAGLDLQAEGKLKYVYDFGDWIEHEITLEAIDEPQAGVEYPRVSEQNKPRYQYCEYCKNEGRQTVAKWDCIWCSNDEGRDVLMCDECADKHDEEHYIVEIVY